MRLFLTDKKIICLKNNPAAFLNGLTSNDLSTPNNAFLNIHGKIVATFAQKIISENEIWICLEKAVVETVLTHIDKYATLAKVQLDILDHRVYYDLDGTYHPKGDEVSMPQKSGQLVVTPDNLGATVSQEQFSLFRLEKGIPLQGVDYHDEFILNVSADEFVSFTKGCYLGQEPVSKVHSRSKPTWKLVIKYEDECSAQEHRQMTSLTKDQKEGRTAGFVFVKND